MRLVYKDLRYAFVPVGDSPLDWMDIAVTYKGETRRFRVSDLLLERGYDSVEEMLDWILENW